MKTTHISALLLLAALSGYAKEKTDLTTLVVLNHTTNTLGIIAYGAFSVAVAGDFEKDELANLAPGARWAFVGPNEVFEFQIEDSEWELSREGDLIIHTDTYESWYVGWFDWEDFKKWRWWSIEVFRAPDGSLAVGPLLKKSPYKGK